MARKAFVRRHRGSHRRPREASRRDEVCPERLRDPRVRRRAPVRLGTAGLGLDAFDLQPGDGVDVRMRGQLVQHLLPPSPLHRELVVTRARGVEQGSGVDRHRAVRPGETLGETLRLGHGVPPALCQTLRDLAALGGVVALEGNVPARGRRRLPLAEVVEGEPDAIHGIRTRKVRTVGVVGLGEQAVGVGVEGPLVARRQVVQAPVGAVERVSRPVGRHPDGLGPRGSGVHGVGDGFERAHVRRGLLPPPHPGPVHLRGEPHALLGAVRGVHAVEGVRESPGVRRRELVEIRRRLERQDERCPLGCGRGGRALPAPLRGGIQGIGQTDAVGRRRLTESPSVPLRGVSTPVQLGGEPQAPCVRAG